MTTTTTLTLGLLAVLLLVGAATAAADPAQAASDAATCDPVFWSPGTPPMPNVDPGCLGPVLDNLP